MPNSISVAILEKSSARRQERSLNALPRFGAPLAAPVESSDAHPQFLRHRAPAEPSAPQYFDSRDIEALSRSSQALPFGTRVAKPRPNALGNQTVF